MHKSKLKYLLKYGNYENVSTEDTFACLDALVYKYNTIIMHYILTIDAKQKDTEKSEPQDNTE